MIRSPLASLVLEKLAELGEGTLDAFFPENYPYAAVWRPLLGLDKRKKKITRRDMSSVLWRLQMQGLVERSGSARKSSWRLTPEGKSLYAGQKEREQERREKDGITRLVIFDIPERERRKRDVVRAELIECNFRQLQKSVWIGECPLPKSFIALVDDFNLGGKLHIFSIRERGTIS
ncbi:MAG: hypothetical protein HY007_01740 [Candidatus Sungbacteria bacterium]|nr:hypothetical protein [Candidatus Sungbacteria bacterium]